jgi:hypothetical protein
MDNILIIQSFNISIQIISKQKEYLKQFILELKTFI